MAFVFFGAPAVVFRICEPENQTEYRNATSKSKDIRAAPMIFTLRHLHRNKNFLIKFPSLLLLIFISVQLVLLASTF